MYCLICTDAIRVQLHKKHERDITDLIKYAATRNKGDAQDAPLVHII